MIKILAIDDNNDNLISLRAIIQDTFPESELLTAMNGSSGIELALMNDPDVILLDIVMPGMDGFEVCLKLKSDERSKYIPVVFLTALGGDKKSRAKALEVGAEAFLSKPIDETELAAQIRAMNIIKSYNKQKRNEKEYLMALVAERTRELKEINELNESLLKTIPFGMDIVDETGNILFISDNLKKQLGKNPLGKKCWSFYRDDQTQCINCPLLKGITIGETSIYESSNVLGGKTFQIIHTGMIFQGKKAMLEIFQDITEMLQSRAELIVAKEKAEEGSRLKSAFLNNMSHEIRTPMNHIMGFSSLMAEAQGAEKDSYAEIILNSSNQLLSLIENVILLSRLQSEKMELNKYEFQPKTLILNIIKNFKFENPKTDFTLNFRAKNKFHDLTIMADFEKIRQILSNLTSNAVKYTLAGTIELGFEIQSGKITFFVKDTGLGIPLWEQQKIFDSFYRSEQALSLVIGGTGLGLSIVKELVGAMDGVIELESSTGKGSCFSFTVPFEQPESSIDETSKVFKFHKPLHEMNLLIADDEEINYLYLEILLKNSILRMDHALNGNLAIDMVENNSYDLILMDLKMPGMDGFEATRRLKQNFPSLPIIAQTAYATTEDKEKAMSAGCDDFIAKPIKKDILLDIIRKFS